MTFDTHEYLNDDRNADLEFPITTWEQAPQLKLKVRLTESTSEGSSSAVTVFGRQNSFRHQTHATAELHHCSG